MVVEDPSDQAIHQFQEIQRHKRHELTYTHTSLLPYYSYAFHIVWMGSFFYSYSRANSPYAPVTKILYDRKLTFMQRQIKYYKPLFIGLGGIFLLDLYDGVWLGAYTGQVTAFHVPSD